MANQRTYSKYTLKAVTLLGEQIKLGRKQHQWSEKNLSERAGISRATLQKIENGEMGCAIGLVFEVATLVGVNLFEQGKPPLSRHLEQTIVPHRPGEAEASIPVSSLRAQRGNLSQSCKNSQCPVDRHQA